MIEHNSIVKNYTASIMEMRAFAALSLAALALTACDLPDSSIQPHHAWKDASIGTHIHSDSDNPTGDSMQTSDTTLLQNMQRSSQICAGITCGK